MPGTGGRLADKVWATELAGFGVRVNCISPGAIVISPGAIVTPVFWGGYQTRSSKEDDDRTHRLVEHFEDRLPRERAGQPEDIAHAAVYPASDESLHTTGHNRMVDAGLAVRLAPRKQLDENRTARAKQIADE